MLTCFPALTWACASNTFDELAAIQPDFEQNGGAGILRAVIWSSGTRNNQGWFFRSHHLALAGQMHCAGHGTVHATGTGAQLRGGTGVILGQMKALDQGFKVHAFLQGSGQQRMRGGRCRISSASKSVILARHGPAYCDADEYYCAKWTKMLLWATATRGMAVCFVWTTPSC